MIVDSNQISVHIMATAAYSKLHPLACTVRGKLRKSISHDRQLHDRNSEDFISLRNISLKFYRYKILGNQVQKGIRIIILAKFFDRKYDQGPWFGYRYVYMKHLLAECKIFTINLCISMLKELAAFLLSTVERVTDPQRITYNYSTKTRLILQAGRGWFIYL